MKLRQIVLILMTSAPLAAGAAEFFQLSPAQKQQAAALGADVEKQCLQGAEAPAGAARMVRTMLEWSKDPAVCSCLGARVRDGITMKYFLYNETARRQWLNETVAQGAMECSVPVFKEKFFASCESLLATEFASASNNGKSVPDVDARIARMCSCSREKLAPISTQEWIDSSVRSYNEYLERKRQGGGNPKPPQSPLNSAVETCAGEFAK